MAGVKSAMNKVSVLSSLIRRAGPRNYYTYTNEPAQPIKGKEPIWTTLDNAFDILKSGN